MTYLLDTNVISEWVKPAPEPALVSWVEEVDEDRLFLSVASLAELRRGVDLLPEGRRRDRLASWLEEELVDRFQDRIVEIDLRIAQTWGRLLARARRAGIGLSTMDAVFAATAEAGGLTLVTRNTRHFTQLGIPLIDPWPSG